jgi:hypothetical protein
MPDHSPYPYPCLDSLHDKGSTTEAVHCLLCDHECSTAELSCCRCSLPLGEGDEENERYPRRQSEATAVKSKEVHNADVETSFPQFSLLPKELRLYIWELSLPGPRVVFLEAWYLKPFNSHCIFSDRGVVIDSRQLVGQSRELGELHYVTFEDEPHAIQDEKILDGFGPPWALFGLRSKSSIPLLYVCRESYKVTSTYYERAFGTVSAFPQTWFNFKSDTLYLDFMLPYDTFFRPDYISDDIKRVERLAIFVHPDAETLPIAPQSLSELVHELLCVFGNVRELYFVVKRYNSSDRANLIFSTIKHDFDTAMSLYSKPYNPQEDFEFQSKETDYANTIDNLFMPHLTSLEAFRVAEVGKHCLPKYTMPRIESRIITSEQTHQRLIEAQHGYALERAEFWKEMRDEFWQRNEYSFRFEAVGSDQPKTHMHYLSNTLVESMEAYLRSAWDLPGESEIAILLGDNKLDSWRTIKDAAGVCPDCNVAGTLESGPDIPHRYMYMFLRASIDGKMESP